LRKAAFEIAEDELKSPDRRTTGDNRNKDGRRPEKAEHDRNKRNTSDRFLKTGDEI
jgi:hypothetical protein